MKLYEIDRRIDAIMMEVEAAGGELTPEQDNALEALGLERAAKFGNIGRLIKNLAAMKEALDAEKKRLAARASSYERKVAWLMSYLGHSLGEDNTFTDGVITLDWLPSKAIEIVDEKLLPKEFWREKLTVEPNKVDIRKAIEAKKEVPGAELVTRMNLQVK